MTKVKEFQTTPFTIAHYILLFMVTVVCVSIVAWLIIGRYNTGLTNNVSVSYRLSKDPCVVQTREAIAKMWDYNQELIPMRYKTMVDMYINDAILTRFSGYCKDTAFTCRAGQLRRTCDPCAIDTGRRQAMERHILDAIDVKCGGVAAKK